MFLLSRNRHRKSHDEIHQTMLRIIESESHTYPYDDEQISVLLKKRGIFLTRRRVSQYGKKWNILNSYQRKQKYKNNNLF